MGRFTITAALALLSAPAQAGVEIIVSDGRLDVSAAQAPLSDVLDGLARKTRMKVVYDGGAPRNPVTVELRGRTPAEAVLGVLEGLGMNYMLALDLSGTEVETLMIVGGAGGFFSPMGTPVRASHGGLREAAPDEDAGNDPAMEYEAPAPVPVPVPAPKEEVTRPAAPVGPLNPSPSPNPNSPPNH